MKKIKMYIVSILVIGLFIIIMTTGGILKRPFSKTDDVLANIENLKINVIDENWEKAEETLENLKSAWKVVEQRVQFSVERDEMLAFNTSIARIEGAILIRDKSAAVIEISELAEHWNELEK